MRPDGRKLTLSGIGYAPYTHAQAWAIVLICCEVLLEPGCDEWQWFHAFFCFGPFRNDCFKKVLFAGNGADTYWKRFRIWSEKQFPDRMPAVGAFL